MLGFVLKDQRSQDEMMSYIFPHISHQYNDDDDEHSIALNDGNVGFWSQRSSNIRWNNVIYFSHISHQWNNDDDEHLIALKTMAMLGFVLKDQRS